MHIDSKKLNEVAALMEEHGLTRVRISEEDGRSIELERMEAPAAPPAPAPMPAPPMPPTPMPQAPAASATVSATANPTTEPANASEPVPVVDDTVAVTAPMVGVFYAAPSPGAEPFVTVGSTVHTGDTLCIIEAMKLMNEVVAETDGTVTEICAQDGDLVEFGSCIMKITPGGEA